jgi:uncharacterized protein with GYD domain
MAYYMMQVAYTPEALATMVKNPQDRAAAVRPVFERLGGHLHSAFLAFGEYDSVMIVEMPDNVNAAACSLAMSAGGAVKAFKTTTLMTVEEMIESLKRAGTVSYRPPS